MTSYKKGICCGCQSEVAIQPCGLPRQEERERGFDDDDINMTYGTSIDFVVVEHSFFGEHCEGSGQIPQVIVN
jgi:hypothetical protein